MHRGVHESKCSEGEHAEAAVKAGAHAEYYNHGLRRQNTPWTGVRLYVLSIERRALALRNTSTWVLLLGRVRHPLTGRYTISQRGVYSY